MVAVILREKKHDQETDDPRGITNFLLGFQVENSECPLSQRVTQCAS